MTVLWAKAAELMVSMAAAASMVLRMGCSPFPTPDIKATPAMRHSSQRAFRPAEDRRNQSN
jgi:hypothetical protein